jgi:ubiquinol-cytochrome c reductase cytochrome b subunit
MIYIFRILFIVGPFIAFFLTRRICLSLQRKDRELVLHGHETGQIIRLPHGEFQERHQPLTPHEVWALTAFETPQVLPAQPGKDGKVSGLERVRARMAKYFYEDRIHPVTKAELDAAHEAHHHDEVAAGDHDDHKGLEK